MTDKNNEVLLEIDQLVQKGKLALSEYLLMTQEQIDYIVAKASVAGVDQHGALALSAVNETRRGVFEDKATKNMFACEHVVHYMKDIKTVGIISDNESTGIVEIADPVGVVAAITPVTNPTSTVLFKSLLALKTRNPIIFSFHPSAQACSKEAALVIYEAAVKAGAPLNCIQFIEKGSLEKTNALMNHEGVATILATGGNAMVKAAYSCGKPALGVGAGNVPAYIEKSCHVAQAVNDIVLSKAFDNGMVCASEQAIIVDHEIIDAIIEGLEKHGVYFVSNKEKKLLENYMFPNGKLNPNVVGQSAVKIAKEAGFIVPERSVILGVMCKEVGGLELLTQEKLSPVLAVLESKDTSHGFKLAKDMVELNGLGHSAAIHTSSKDLAVAFGQEMPAIRIIWNAPSTFGGIGNIYNDFIPSLTLGCGSYGHNSVGDNVNAIHLLNIKKVGRRNNNMQWFKVPKDIYFERNSIRYLSSMEDVKKVLIVSDQTMVDLGYTQLIVDQLNLQKEPVIIQMYTEVEPDPSLETVRAGTKVMNAFNPDTIIALGGGSPMDAAKAMWIFYEHPQIDFNDLKQKFLDIRKRAFKYPDLGAKAKLICIPTTSGTGSEVTPFAVITDKVNNKKYPLADYAMVPNVAIIDPIFTTRLPKHVTADTGLDVLTHATESFVSNFASDYTDSLAIQAVQMVFEYLERCVHNGENDLIAREKLHNASTMAGMAFGNAFLGVNHSLAHKIGGRWSVPHGRINAILMPHVIRYNGQIPTKLSLWPKYNTYQAHERYAKLARILGLKADTVEEGVESYAQACHNLALACGVDMSLKAQGIGKKDFDQHKESIAYMAYEDQCSPCNPRLPMVHDLIGILDLAYEG